MSESARPLADRVDRILSISAVVAALSAVVVSMYQARLARAQLESAAAQQKAAAWPYVSQGNSYTRGSPYRWLITSAGVGPARVRTFEVLVDGVPRRTWADVGRALVGGAEQRLVYSHVGRGTVLLAGSTMSAVTLPDDPYAMRFWTEAQTRLRTRLCYCSVYDDCWLADSDADEPTPVAACTLDRARAFQN